MIDPVPRSRKRIAPFHLHRPSTVVEAVGLLAELDDAVPMAGGIEVLNRMKAGWRASHVISLSGIAELGAVRSEGGKLCIGAGVTLHGLARHETIRQTTPGLATAMVPVANVRIRHQATLGGNVLAGTPHYDVLPCLAALDATLVLATAGGTVEITARNFAASAEAMPPRALLLHAAIPGGADIIVHDRSMLPGFLLTLGRRADGVAVAAVAGAHTRPQAGSLGITAGEFAGGLTPDAAAAISSDWVRILPPMRDTLHMSAGWRRRVVPVALSRLLAAQGGGRIAA